MAALNAASTIDAALWSARAQTLADIEIIVVDDGSSDGTRERLDAQRAADARITVLDGSRQGPGAARNRALAVASGEAVAVLDADDIMHPERLQRLLALSHETGAEIVADNLLAFFDDLARRAPYLLAIGPDWLAERDVSLADYVRCNVLGGRGPALGYLKPLIRRAALGRLPGGYDETLRIGEDYDFVARLLLGGARFRFSPAPLYLYRRHAASTSYRIRTDDLRALLAAADRLHPALAEHGAGAASAARRASVATALLFDELIGTLKRKAVRQATGLLWRQPTLLSLLAQSAREGVERRVRARFATAREPEAGLGATHATLIGDRDDPALRDAATLLRGKGFTVDTIASAGASTDERFRMVAAARPSAILGLRRRDWPEASWCLSPLAALLLLDGPAIEPLAPAADLVLDVGADAIRPAPAHAAAEANQPLGVLLSAATRRKRP